jgi:hypothetical protein
LKGTIGNNLAVTLDLVKTDSVFSGAYYFDSIAHPIIVTGELLDSNKIFMSASDELYIEECQFSGKFTSADTIEGTWTDLQSKKTYPFRLTTARSGKADVTFEGLSKQKCRPNRNKKEESFRPWTDTLEIKHKHSYKFTNQSLFKKVSGICRLTL